MSILTVILLGLTEAILLAPFFLRYVIDLEPKRDSKAHREWEARRICGRGWKAALAECEAAHLPGDCDLCGRA